MRKYYRSLVQCLSVFLTLLVPADHALAFGWGPSVKYGYTAGTVAEVEDGDELGTTTHGMDLGILLDTNVARRTVFNYRLETALEYRSASWWSEYYDRYYTRPLPDVQVPSLGLALHQTFGFGLVRNPRLRLYLGPSLRLAVLSGSAVPDRVSTKSAPKIGIVQVEAGAGPELGCNIHLRNRVSLALSLAYQAQLQYAAVDDPYRPYDGGQTAYGYLGFTSRVSLGVAVLFRSAADVFQ